MELRPLSASSIKTYTQCLLKYKYRYIDRKPREESRDALALGTAIHAALERLYEIIQATEQLPTTEQLEEIYKIYVDTAVREGLGNLKLLADGKSQVAEKLKYVSLDEKVIGVEVGFELCTDQGTRYLGAMDKVVEVDEETLAVIDYKSSKTALTQDEADSDIQASMYELAASILYPKYKKILVAFEYTREGSHVITHRTKEERKLFVMFIDSIAQSLSEMTPENMVPRLNQFCGWCEFKNFCPEYARAITDTDLRVPRPEQLSDAEIVEEYSRLKNIERAAKSRVDILQDELRNRISGKETIEGEVLEVYKSQRQIKDYDVKSLFKIIPTHDIVNMVSIRSGDLQAYATKNPDLREDIERSLSKSYSSVYFSVRKRRKN